jgi:predicted alpha/beta-hydrolase family hydrolase
LEISILRVLNSAASMLAALEPGLVERLLLLSYPLHPPKKPSELRTGHFPSLQTPALFVRGARDGFGSIAEVGSAIKLIPAATELVAIPGVGHELMNARNREAVAENVMMSFLAFQSSNLNS